MKSVAAAFVMVNSLSAAIVPPAVPVTSGIAALAAVMVGAGAGGVTALGEQQPHKLELLRQQKLGI